MEKPKALPSNPFWSFSTKFYQHPHVEENLLSLQNERGLNVNIVLFCFWYALNDQGRLLKSDLKKIIINIQLWHERIVLPLRRIRRQLKQKPLPGVEVRSEILKDELIAEHIEQLIIFETYSYRSRPVRNNLQKIIDICKNIATYYDLLHIYVDLSDCTKICQMLTTIFVKIDQEAILRYCMEHLREKELQTLILTAQIPLDL